MKYYKTKVLAPAIFLAFIFLFSTINTHAQISDVSEFLNSENDKKEYAKTSKSISKGNLLFEEAQSISRASKKFKKLKKASKYFNKAYRAQFDILASYTHEFEHESEGEKQKKLKELNYFASEKLSLAIGYRREAVEADKSQAVSLYQKAHRMDIEAKDILLKAFGVYYEKSDYSMTEEDPYTIGAVEIRKEYKQKDFAENGFKVIEKDENGTVYAPEDNLIAEEGSSGSVNNDEEYSYSVQIAASRKKFNTNYFSRKYPKLGKINQEFYVGYYRYTFGEYSSYSTASEQKRNCGVKGAFVVAYKNKKRLKNVKYVLASPNEQNLTYNSNSSENNETQAGEEYRIQIGISRLPAHKSQLSKMNKTNKKVMVWKSPNFYKYTIGSFESYREAKNFKNANGLKEAFIVRYKNGSEVKL
ncbi:MAG: hypothetical protein U9N85_09885 [Bacteroidota bacterium]|nr:hypothetical protein [Bacteroidota bacterium]